MGAVFALFAGFYYWTPKIVGKTINDFLGKIHFWSLFVGVKQTVLNCFFSILNLSFSFLLSKPISINDIIERELLDKDTNDIDNDTLDKKFNNLPTSNFPNPKKGKYKLIEEKLNNIQAEAKFIDLKKSKLDILLNIKNKSGVYMFFNLNNGKSYIGSSVNLARRFRIHISSVGKVNLPLPLAINKYGLNNFAFLILKYCEKNINICLGLEQFYLDSYKPKYNILKLAGSSLGFKHSPETIAKLKLMHSGILHPRINKEVTEEQKKLTSLALKKYYRENEHHNKNKKGVLSPQFGIGGTKLIMTSENGDIIKFPSINAARQHFRIRFTTVSLNVNKNKPILIKGIKWFINSE
jgi:group I intron endonuclease